MTPALLLYNPTAGGRLLEPAGIEDLLGRLHRAGFACEAVQTREGPQPVPALDLSKKRLLIVYGGDGTLHYALSRAVEWNCPIGLLPGGTANVLARELGIPLPLEGAVEVLRRGQSRRLQLGTCGERHFHLMLGIGVDGHIVRHVHRDIKKKIGKAAYWWAGLTSFWGCPLDPFEIRLDGDPLEGTFAVVCKVRRYGGDLIMAPDADPFRPGFDVCVFTSRNRFRYPWYLASVLMRRHTRLKDVVYRRAEIVEAEGLGEIPVQMDGELAGTLPVRVSSGDSIEILVP